MKGQSFLKAMSIILILVCLFGLVAAGLGVVEVLDEKKQKEAEKEETLASIATLEAGINQLESKRADYEAGKAQIEAGQKEYDAGKEKIESGTKEYEAKLAEYQAGKAELEKNTATYNAGKATYNAGLAKLNSGKATYNAGLNEYNAGKADYDTNLATYNAKSAGLVQLETLNAGLTQFRSATGLPANASEAQFTGTLNGGIAQAEDGIAKLDAGIAQVEDGIAKTEAAGGDTTALKTQLETLTQQRKGAADQLTTLKTLQGGVAQAQSSGQITDASGNPITGYNAILALPTFITASKQALADAEQLLAAGKAKLEAAAVQLAAARADIAKGESDLAAGKAKLDEYEAGQAKLAAAEPQLAAAKKQLDEGKVGLEAAAKQLEDGKTQLAEFESGEKQVNDGKATLLANADIKAKVDGNMDLIAAGREVVDEQTVITTARLMSRVYQYIALAVAALLGLIAGIMGFSAAKMPSVGKIKGGILLGIIALVVAIGANVFGIMKTYAEQPLQMVGMIAVACAAALFVVAILRYKNALVAMLTAD